MKRVAFLISTLNVGGAQRILSNMVTNMPEDWDIDIVLNDTQNIVYPYKGNLIDLKVPTSDNKQSVFYQAKAFTRRYKALKRLKRENHYDAVISFLDSANIVNILTGNRYCRTILTAHSTLSRNTTEKEYKYIVAPLIKLYEKADLVVCVSEGIRRDFIDQFGLKERNLRTIYNGYDVNAIRELAKEELTLKEETYIADCFPIVAMGRFVHAKGFWHLLRAMKYVKEKVPHVKLIFLGEGPMESYMKQLVQECGLEQNVQFAGFCKNPFHIISKCRFAVASSIFEGFCNAIAEAMSCGVPMISTDHHSGAREMLAPGTDIQNTVKDRIDYAPYGVLTPVCDGTQYDGYQPLTKEEQLLGEAIVTLAQDEALQEKYCKQSLERAEQLDIKHCIGQWVDLIESNK